MGNDGGSIPKRRELVKNAARAPTVSELKATAHESLTHAWSYDPITAGPLDMESIVSDGLGRLYNYESVLKALLPSDAHDDGTTPPSATSNGELPQFSFSSTGIKSLRDVVKLKFKRYSPPGKKGEEVWACPVSLKELGPSTRAVYLVPCGHVFAEVATKHMDDEQVCPECSEPFQPRDVIPILPTEKSDLEKLAARLEELKSKGLTHNLKKDKGGGKKKRKAEGPTAEDGDGRLEEKGKRKSAEDPSPATSKSSIENRVSGINNPLTASLTAKVLAEQEERNKRRKLAPQR